MLIILKHLKQAGLTYSTQHYYQTFKILFQDYNALILKHGHHKIRL